MRGRLAPIPRRCRWGPAPPMLSPPLVARLRLASTPRSPSNSRPIGQLPSSQVLEHRSARPTSPPSVFSRACCTSRFRVRRTSRRGPSASNVDATRKSKFRCHVGRLPYYKFSISFSHESDLRLAVGNSSLHSAPQRKCPHHSASQHSPHQTSDAGFEAHILKAERRLHTLDVVSQPSRTFKSPRARRDAPNKRRS